MFRLAFGKRPAEELYLVEKDPYDLNNVAGDPAYGTVKQSLEQRLQKHLTGTRDPRATGNGSSLDAIMKRYPVLGSNSDSSL